MKVESPAPNQPDDIPQSGVGGDTSETSPKMIGTPARQGNAHSTVAILELGDLTTDLCLCPSIRLHMGG